MNDDNYTPGYAVEPQLLLEYLIQKSEELSIKNYRGFPLHYRGFGLVTLDPFPKLQEEFLKTTAKSDDPVSERAETCKKIFIEALSRPQGDRNPEDHRRDESSEDHPFGRVLANRFAWEARRLGESMLERQDFQHIRVWECMSFIAFQEDAERFNKFQEKCGQHSDPKERIEAVIPLLWEVVRTRTRKSQAPSEQVN